MRFDSTLVPALVGLGLVVGLMVGWWLVGTVLVPFIWRLF